MDSILPLSVRGPLPKPVTKSPPPRADSAEDELVSSGVDGASPRATSAAYQALPVSGALITHNYTPALPVLDADELDKEVRKRRLKWADQPPRRRWRPPQRPRLPALTCPKSRRSAERAAAAGGLPPAPLGGRHPRSNAARFCPYHPLRAPPCVPQELEARINKVINVVTGRSVCHLGSWS